ncbi:MAG: precorrin-8X methylmutase [Phormidesmis sp.]
MPAYCEHPITLASFEQIDREMGHHHFTAEEYAIVRRVIHTTADFEFSQLLHFRQQPFDAAIAAFRQDLPIVTDVSMVAAGIQSVVARTWHSSVEVAVQRTPRRPFASSHTSPAQTSRDQPINTRSASGMRQCAHDYPSAIFAVGNAPTALLALCEAIARGDCQPTLVIGAPVGFINVVESKQALGELAVPHILVAGRKGGSAVAAAILNALMIGSWERSP